MDESTFSNPSVVAEMKNLICLNLDTESEEGGKVARAYGVGPLPTLLFLEPDGAVRDIVLGYMAPEPFEEEVERIRRNEGTISGLRARVAADPGDLAARYGLSKRLALVGDAEGAEEQRAAIREQDPECVSLAARWVRFDDAMIVLEELEVPNSEGIRALLKGESDQGLLFEGWSVVQRVHQYLALEAEGAEERGREFGISMQALRRMWSHCADEERGEVANDLAWTCWEHRADLSADDKEFALGLAALAVEGAREKASVVDTYACCLFMNGRRAEAVEQVMRCIELEPGEEKWPERLQSFEGGGA